MARRRAPWPRRGRSSPAPAAGCAASAGGPRCRPRPRRARAGGACWMPSNTTDAGSAPALPAKLARPRARAHGDHLLDAGRAIGVGRHDQRLASLASQPVRELADGRRLAGAVDAVQQDARRAPAPGRARADCRDISAERRARPSASRASSTRARRRVRTCGARVATPSPGRRRRRSAALPARRSNPAPSGGPSARRPAASSAAGAATDSTPHAVEPKPALSARRLGRHGRLADIFEAHRDEVRRAALVEVDAVKRGRVRHRHVVVSDDEELPLGSRAGPASRRTGRRWRRRGRRRPRRGS